MISESNDILFEPLTRDSADGTPRAAPVYGTLPSEIALTERAAARGER